MTSIITSETIISNNVIFITSEDAGKNGVYLRGTNDRSSFGLYLKKELKSKSDELFKIIVQSAEIPYTFTNLNINNNYIDWSENGILQTPIQITDGNYNILQLLEEIKETLNTNTSISATYNLTYNQNTNKVSIISDNVLDTIFLFNSGVNVLKSINSQLGFTDDEDITINNLSTGISDSVVNLLLLTSLFIRSNLSSLNTIDSFTTSNSSILVNIPITTIPLSIINYQYYDGVEYNLIDDNSINYIELSLTDSKGIAIDLKKKINWSLTLNIQVIKDPSYIAPSLVNLDEKVEDINITNNSNNPMDEMVDETNILNQSKDILNKITPEHTEHKNIINGILEKVKT